MSKAAKEFKKKYLEVFDENNQVTACGRDKCKELMQLAEKVKNDIDFGDKKSGKLNIENITKLYSDLGESNE